MDKRTRLGAIGIDLQRYSFFNGVSPKAIYMASDYPTLGDIQFDDPTPEHYKTAFMFVVDTAIRLSANDYTLKLSKIGRIYRERHFDPNHVGAPTVARGVHKSSGSNSGADTAGVDLDES